MIFAFRVVCYLLVMTSLFHAQDQKVVRTNKRTVLFTVNGKSNNWWFYPDSNPNIFRIYCSKEKNEVILKTDIETCSFIVSNNDTIRFKFNYKGDKEVYTEIIGMKDIPNSIKTNEKLYWLSQIWSETKYNFVNIDLLKFNLDSLYKAYIPLVAESADDYEYYRLLKKFIARMNDGHTEVHDWEVFSVLQDYIPLYTKAFDNKVYITSVRKAPGLDSTWIGAEVIEIDNTPTLKYLEENIFPYIASSTKEFLWTYGSDALRWNFKDKLFNGKIKKRDGTVTEIVLKRNGGETQNPNDKYWGAEIQNENSIVDLHWMESKIALVHFNSFSAGDKAIEEFNKLLPELYKAEGIIIDIRKNAGGVSPVAFHIQKFFTTGKEFRNFGSETRINDGAAKANGNWREEYKSFYLNKAYRFDKGDSTVVPDTLKRFTCPAAILFGRNTFSAAEDLLINIYEAPGRPFLLVKNREGQPVHP